MFLSQLQALTPPASRFSVEDSTHLLNILRCGSNIPELLAFAPGLPLSRLLAAYLYLDTFLQNAWVLWEDLLTESSATKMLFAKDILTPIFPAFSRVVREAERDPGKMETLLKALEQERLFAEKSAKRIEDQLLLVSKEEAVDLGQKLYDPYSDSLWGNLYFFPTRVGSIYPTRLLRLLENIPNYS